MSSSEVKLLLRDSGLGSEGQDAIAARANGNPLYVALIRDGLKTRTITVDDLVHSFPIDHK
jgi:hypothetical protein